MAGAGSPRAALANILYLVLLSRSHGRIGHEQGAGHDPKAREALGITPGSKIEFDIAGGAPRLKLVKRQVASRIEEGAAILDYKAPRIPVANKHAWRLGDEEGS